MNNSAELIWRSNDCMAGWTLFYKNRIDQMFQHSLANPRNAHGALDFALLLSQTIDEVHPCNDLDKQFLFARTTAACG